MPIAEPITGPGVSIAPKGHFWSTGLPAGHTDGIKPTKLPKLENGCIS